MTKRVVDSALSGHTLVYIAPHVGSGGPGDYATGFVEAARPYFRDVVEIRHRGPGGDTVRDIRRARSRILDVVAAHGPDRTIVHSELSGGSLVPFWALPTDPAIRVTATMHDAPRPVWLPFRTPTIARSRGAIHIVQFPVDRWVRRLEQRRMRHSSIFVLSTCGSRSAQAMFPNWRVIATEHFVPERRDAPSPSTRPLAVGMFGYVYRGKGFGELERLRRLIDPAIEIRVAGRGTEALPTMDGVRVVGPVDGSAEDEFFGSVRMLLAPYGARSLYGGYAVPASGTAARSLAYLTPIAGYAEGTLVEVAATGAGYVVPPKAENLAAWVNASISNGPLLDAMSEAARVARTTRAAERVIVDFVQEWSR
ncbi:MAG: glycosyltransferase family 1 protein [Nocardiaceae bacterium]|nr:glycosyltransferase family 1 protein [Nocardiaceae bacterium]